MSSLNEKLQGPVSALPHSRARRWLLRHCTWSDGKPMYRVLRADKVGVRSFVMQRMGEPTYWRRVLTEGKDALFEQCTQAEAEEG